MEHQPGTGFSVLHGILDLHAKLGIALHVHSNLQGGVSEVEQAFFFLYSVGEIGIRILQLQFDQGRAV